MLSEGLNEPGCQAPIALSKLLLVEGQDQFQFFKALLAHLDLLDTVEIRNYGGICDLGPLLRLLAAPIDGFRDVVSLGVIRDAEADATHAFQAVCDALDSASLSSPGEPMAASQGKPRVCVFILPDCEHPGMLETLCLDSVTTTFPLLCVDAYFQCLRERGLESPSNMGKARLHAYLAGMPRPVPLLGQAAHAGHFPWTSSVFGPIKEFLKAL